MRIAPDTFGFTALIGFLAALPALSIDISAPTLVSLQTDLGTTTTVAGFTLSMFMVGFALGQAAGGALSDRYGRRPLLLSGLAAYAVAAVGCALSPSGAALVVFRFVQGLGAGACAVLAFAIVEDLFEGDAARSKRSYVTVVFGITPVLAPALGALLANRAGWRSVHAVLAVAGLALLTVIWSGVPESRPANASRPASQPGSKKPMVLWHDHQFIGLAAVNALSYGCVFAYIAGSPIVVIGLMGLPTTTYAALFASTALALTFGAWISGKLSRRGVGASAMVGPSLTFSALSAMSLLALSLPASIPASLLVLLLLTTLFCRGMIAPNVQHLAVQRRREQVGTASAVVGVSQILTGALASTAVALLLPSLGQAAVAGCMAVLAVGATAGWWWMTRSRPSL